MDRIKVRSGLSGYRRIRNEGATPAIDTGQSAAAKLQAPSARIQKEL
jgi:hypothetical protein